MILDLDGDGVEADGIGFFDHAGDGWNELTRWANEDDGVLVWDKDNDGVISDGSELFGDSSVLASGKKAANGFAALAELDSNSDGVVDASDAKWSELELMRWKDANGNGIKDAGEEYFVGLETAGVESLNTAYTNSDHVDASGNEHRQVGSYTKTDGTTAKMTDVWFVTDARAVTYDKSSIPEHSDAIKALPEITGRGRVYTLRDAMALDDAKDADGSSLLQGALYETKRSETRTLREMVAAFTETDADGNAVLDAEKRSALAEKILLRWSGAEGVAAKNYWIRSSGSTVDMDYTTSERLAVAETFQGSKWREGESNRNPAYKTAQKVDRIYLNHLERLYASLMMQSHLKDLHAAIKVSLAEGAKEDSTDPDDYGLDFSGVETLLSAEKNARRGEWLRSLAGLYGSSEWLLSSIKETASGWVYEYEYYADYLARAVFDGNTHRVNDYVGDCGCTGGLRDNVFQTTDGGNDRLEGRGGDDTYYLGIGTGHDRIEEVWRDSDWGGDKNDVIRAAPGIGKDMVKLSRTLDDLIVTLYKADGTVDSSLTVAGHFADAVARVEKVMFADDTIWEAADLQAAVFFSGQGSAGADIYDGGADGKDLTLQGGSGGDVYLFGRGSGRDAVNEADYNVAVNSDKDIVRLKAGLSAADVRLNRTRHDLVIEALAADGKSVDSALTIKGYYANDAAKIERVELNDGSLVWGTADFAKVAWTVLVYADGSGEITGGAGNESLRGSGNVNDVFDSDGGGNDRLYGYGGDDVYWLGAGTGHDAICEYYQNTGDSGDMIKVKSGYAPADIRLARSNDGDDLIIQLLNDKGSVSDSLTVDSYYTDDSAKVEGLEFADGTVWNANHFALAEITGGKRGEELHGESGLNDVFDSNGGGNDTLYGYGGDDVYWLGAGTGHDGIYEYYQNTGDSGDMIKVKSGYALADVRLARSNDGDDLIVQLLDDKGAVSDSLTVDSYYTDDSAKVEGLEFADGTVWNANHFALAEITGGKRGEELHGESGLNDVFDSNGGGNDTLYGYGGDDVYWLGAGTGHDGIYEYYQNAGDSGDMIKVKSGYAIADVRLTRSGSHLVVSLLDDKGLVSDSLKVEYHFTDASAKIESIEAAGHVLLENQFQGLIDEIAAFTAGTSSYDSLNAIHSHYWDEETTLSSSSS